MLISAVICISVTAWVLGWIAMGGQGFGHSEPAPCTGESLRARLSSGSGSNPRTSQLLYHAPAGHGHSHSHGHPGPFMQLFAVPTGPIEEAGCASGEWGLQKSGVLRSAAAATAAAAAAAHRVSCGDDDGGGEADSCADKSCDLLEGRCGSLDSAEGGGYCVGHKTGSLHGDEDGTGDAGHMAASAAAAAHGGDGGVAVLPVGQVGGAARSEGCWGQGQGQLGLVWCWWRGQDDAGVARWWCKEEDRPLSLGPSQCKLVLDLGSFE